jgi:hypothetical protein
MAFLLQRISAANNFLAGLRGNPMVAQAETSQRDALRRMMAMSPVGLVEAAGIRTSIENATDFSEDSRRTLLQSMRVVAAKTRQDYTMFPAYLSDAQWQDLDNRPIDYVIEFGCRFVNALGCQSGTEPTGAQVAAFALTVACKSSLAATQVPPETKRTVFVATKRALAQFGSPDAAALVQTLTLDATGFMQSHPAAYACALGGGIHSQRPPYSVAAISSVAGTIVQRVRKQAPASPTQLDFGSMVSALVSALVPSLGHLPQQQQQQQQLQQGQPLIRILSEHERNMARSRTLPALTAGGSPVGFGASAEASQPPALLADASAAPATGASSIQLDSVPLQHAGHAALPTATTAASSDADAYKAMTDDNVDAARSPAMLKLALAQRTAIRKKPAAADKMLKKPAAASKLGKKPAARDGRGNRIDHEASRSQFLVRPSGGKPSVTFPYKGAAQKIKAKQSAEQCLADRG